MSGDGESMCARLTVKDTQAADSGLVDALLPHIQEMKMMGLQWFVYV